MITRIYHRPALLLAFLFAVLATAVQASPNGMPNNVQNDVPLRANLSVQEQIVPDASCPSGFSGTLTGSGTATHLGAVAINAPHCAMPTRGGSVAISRGEITFTAANGDTLTADFMGTISPFPDDLETNTFVGNFVITGGTGRFANAEGNGLLSGTLSGSLAPPRFYSGSITADGRISY